MAMTEQTQCFPMSNHTKERVTMTKMTLENFYSNLIAQHEERELRQKRLEKVMEEEGLRDEEKKNEEISTCPKRNRISSAKKDAVGARGF